MKTGKCLYCGGEFTYGGKLKKYCSMGCYRLAQRSGTYKTGHTMFLAGKCSFCDKDVYCASGSAVGKHVYCNRTCYDKHRTKLQKERSVICKYCGISFIPEANKKRVYCSHECRYADKLPNKRKCMVCGKLFLPTYIHTNGEIKHPNNRKICSLECVHEFYKTDVARKEKISKAMTGALHPNWQGGRVEYRGDNWHTNRRTVLKRDKVCQHCGMSSDQHIAMYGSDLEVHHITPLRYYINVEDANDIGNLIVLCKSDHKIMEWKFRKGMENYDAS